MPHPRVIPRQKTLLGYARALARAESAAQVAIIRDSYHSQLSEPGELEVLDLLEQATLAARFRDPQVTPGAELGPQQLALRVMRSAAAANGFHLRLSHVEIEIEKG